MSSDRPVFVVGCPRSGTTLLALMIHAHPRLAMPPETRFLISTWRRRREFGDLRDEQHRRALARAIVAKGSKVKDLGVRRRDLRRRIVEAPPTLGSALGTVFQEYARLHGKARWGDKRPLYYQEVDVLLRLFPDAQLVHVVRDARANVASLKRMPWWPYGSVGALASWALAEQCMRRNARRLPADTFHTVRYESLVADPRAELGRLCAFLDEDFDEAMLRPHLVTGVVPDRKHWHGNTRRPVEPGTEPRAEAWRTELTAAEVGLVERLHGRALERHGYQLSGDGSTPSPALLARYARSFAAFQLSARSRWVAESWDAKRSSRPVAARLTSAQRAVPGAD